MAAIDLATERNRLLAKIHCAKRDLALDDACYRAMLTEVTGKDSAGDCNRAQLLAVVRHLAARGWGKKKGGYPRRPKNMDRADSRSRQLKKIEAYLAEAGRPWAYADSMAKRICKMDLIQWVPTGNLYKIIAALKRDAERHGREPER